MYFFFKEIRTVKNFLTSEAIHFCIPPSSECSTCHTVNTEQRVIYGLVHSIYTHTFHLSSTYYECIAIWSQSRKNTRSAQHYAYSKIPTLCQLNLVLLPQIPIVPPSSSLILIFHHYPVPSNLHEICRDHIGGTIVLKK